MNKSKSSASASSINKRVKAKYPKISYEANPKSNTRASKDADHLTSLTELMEQICKSEANGLKKQFESSSDLETVKGKKLIYDLMTKILKGLPGKVKEKCSPSCQFSAELSKEEKVEVKSLLKKRKSLQEYSDKLSSYEEDLTTLKNELKVWLGSAPAVEMAKRGAPNQLDEISSQYLSQLKKIESNCDQILVELDSCKKTMQTSRLSQDKLYESYNRVSQCVGCICYALYYTPDSAWMYV